MFATASAAASSPRRSSAAAASAAAAAATALLLALGSAAGAASAAAAAPAQSFFSQAEPSAQEQFLLELVNRARANPAAEGAMLATITDPTALQNYSYYSVDTGKLRSDFASYAAQPPLAFSPALMSSARTQALDQATHGFQGHSGTNGSTLRDRLLAVDYGFHMAGENTYAYAENPLFGHIGLNADWGVPDLDHRENIMNYEAGGPVYREVGIACVPSAVAGFGPLVITQDFGVPADDTRAYVLGVIYQDKNANGRYDEGEGLGGVSVTPDAGGFFTKTSASGGFALPLPAGVASGRLGLTASGAGLGAPRRKSVSFVAGRNVKVDFTSADAADTRVAQVAVQALSAVASSDGSRVGVVTVTRAGGDLAKALAVELNVGGSAKAGVDYHSLPKSLTIAPGHKSVTLRIKGTGATFSGTRKVRLSVDAGSGYLTTGPTQVQVKILGQN